MPLSEHEQRLLDQIERALYAEDPKFASTVRGARLRKPSRRRRLQGVVLFVVGVLALVLGVVFAHATLPALLAVTVVGFLFMLSGAVLAVTSAGAGSKATTEGGGDTEPAAEKERSRFTSRMEERFRKRFDQE